MEFERLKKSHKKEIIIGTLAVCAIGGALTFATTRAKYKVTQDVKLVNGTINYKPYDFKVMAMYQQNDSGTYTEINEMPSTGYVINEEKTYCTTDNQTEVKGKIKTINGNVAISNLSKSDKCYIWFDKKTSVDNASDLLAKVQSEAKTTAPDFSQVATTDEGIFATEDGMYGGYSYYWRGAVTNNYVRFANFCWRIVRINGDGSIRLIYDGTTCHANGTSTTENIAVSDVKYSSIGDQSNHVGWTYTGTSQRTLSGTASNAKTQLESWYSSNITGTNTSKIADGKFCNDRNTASESTWSATGSMFYYAAYKRIITDHVPSLACDSGDIYTLNVGLITADEAMYAGGTNADNTSYYLYNGQGYWTMSPYFWSHSAFVFIAFPRGNLHYSYANYTNAVRPVINLRSDTLFATGGNGTQSNPYVVQ